MRRITLWVGLTFAVCGGTLAFLEWCRPRVDLTAERATETPNTGVQAARDTADVAVVDLSNPKKFAVFLQQLRANYRAMHDRYLSLRHQEAITEEEVGADGAILTTREHAEEVWFQGTDEHRRPLVSNAAGGTAQATIIPESPPMSKPIYPFYAEDQPGFYRYEFAGMEEIAGEQLVRIRFEPNPPLESKMRGSVWVDPKRGEPRRFDGVMAKPPVFLDGFRMTAEYGPSENGKTQLRRMTTDGAGGFAFVRKRFRKTVAFHGYVSSSN